MIAHINRSGDMFHENVNVLEYAAISTKARHLNPHANRSLLKSAKKRDLRSKSKSCLKNKSLVDSALHSKTENAK